MLSLRTIIPDTLELLKTLSAEPEMAQMRLVGGTSLALQYGHRQSIDLDFFSAEPFEQEDIIALLGRFGECRIFNRTKTIVQAELQGVKVDVVDYSRYPWIDEPVREDGIVLA